MAASRDQAAGDFNPLPGTQRARPRDCDRLRATDRHRDHVLLQPFLVANAGISAGRDDIDEMSAGPSNGGRYERAFTSSLSRRRIAVVSRISASLRTTPMVDALARSRA